MLNLHYHFLISLLLTGTVLLSPVEAALASDTNEIASVTLMADKRLALPLSIIASRYTQESMVTVSIGFGESGEQERRIEDGEACDLFITAQAGLLEKMKLKGLIDVHSVSTLAGDKHLYYFAAVVAGENMTPARSFLAFLKKGEARDSFRKNDLSVP